MRRRRRSLGAGLWRTGAGLADSAGTRARGGAEGLFDDVVGRGWTLLSPWASGRRSIQGRSSNRWAA